MIKMLAEMAGKRLHSLYLSPDSDANDLIGSYEQVSRRGRGSGGIGIY